MPRWYDLYSGDPNGVVTGAKGRLLSDYTTPGLWQNVDGGTQWRLYGAGGSGASLVSTAWSDPPATVNLTTEGTIDWMGQVSMGSPAWSIPNGVHTRLDGGWLMHALEGYNGVSGGGVTETTSALAGTTFTADAADNRRGVAMSSTTYGVLFSSSGTPLGFGIRFRIPARTTQQVVRIYSSIYAATVRVSGSLTQSGNVSNADVVIGATQTNKQATITFKGIPGDELVAKVSVTANSGSASLSFGAVTVGVV